MVFRARTSSFYRSKARKAHMTNLDVQYDQKKEAQLKRTTPATITSSSQEASSLPDDETSDPEADSEDKEDKEDEEMNRRQKRSSQGTSWLLLRLR